MKKLYLVDTIGTREFWTIEMLPNRNSNAVAVLRMAVLRSLFDDENVGAENCDSVEDDSTWDEVELTEDEYAHLFDWVKIIDEKDF